MLWVGCWWIHLVWLEGNRLKEGKTERERERNISLTNSPFLPTQPPSTPFWKKANKPYNTLFNFPSNYGGYDVTQQFNQLSIPECNGISHPAASLKWPCETDNPATCLDLNQLSITNPPGGIYGLLPMDHLLDNKTSVIPTTAYEWSDIVK